MQDLVEDKVFDAAHPVPCQVRTGDADPGEVSLAENVVRIAMHPADQVTAFAKLADAGQSVPLSRRASARRSASSSSVSASATPRRSCLTPTGQTRSTSKR